MCIVCIGYIKENNIFATILFFIADIFRIGEVVNTLDFDSNMHRFKSYIRNQKERIDISSLRNGAYVSFYFFWIYLLARATKLAVVQQPEYL